MTDIPRDEHGRPRVFLEEKCPVEELGIECQREGGVGLHPPVNRLHVWWARRPLTVSRAAVLGSLLPADYDERDFLALMGVPRGKDPVGARNLIKRIRAGLEKDPGGNLYGYKRAFSNPVSASDKEAMRHAIQSMWGTWPTVLDSFAGGGSIPFEAVRMGFPVVLNELNPVASIIEKATIEYPSKFGLSLKDEISKIGEQIARKVEEKLATCFPRGIGEEELDYIWTRTVTCPQCQLTVPLSPNFWLDKNGKIGYKLAVPPKHAGNTCSFTIAAKGADFDPDQGTVKRGIGTCPRCAYTLDGNYIKREAQEGRMGHQLAAVIAFKRVAKKRVKEFRPPTESDLDGVRAAAEMLRGRLPEWEARGLVPNEEIKEGSKTREPLNKGAKVWADLFSPRQLLVHLTTLEAILDYPWHEIADPKKREALRVYMMVAMDKGLDYNCVINTFESTRVIVKHLFQRHDFAFKWSYAEIDGSGQLFRFCYEQIADAYKGLCSLMPKNDLEKQFITGDAASLQLPDGSVSAVIIDPPYYDNVMYAELSDFFYVWMKRGLGDVLPEYFPAELTDKDAEAVANVARFRDSGRGMGRKLAYRDYEAKMSAAFAECRRVLKDDGVFTVMFTHKKVEAWDTLARSILNAGFEITASWPIHTESEHSLHQAKKNAAASTILLVCRKRPAGVKSAWWEDIRDDLDGHIREKAVEFEEKGIRGQDTFIACFGPALQMLSRNWPVRTKEGAVISPQEALDRARDVVGEWFFEKISYGKSTDIDKVSRFYLVCWFVYKAREVKFDEINRLAISRGIDMDRLKQYKLIQKKGDYVKFLTPAERFRAKGLKVDAEDYRWDIDYVQAAIHSYEVGKSVELARFHQRTGALKRQSYLDTVTYLLDVLPRTDEITEYHTLDDMASASLQAQIGQRRRETRAAQEYSMRQSLLDDHL